MHSFMPKDKKLHVTAFYLHKHEVSLGSTRTELEPRNCKKYDRAQHAVCLRGWHCSCVYSLCGYEISPFTLYSDEDFICRDSSSICEKAQYIEHCLLKI